MATVRFLNRWLQLPGRIALVLGMGALSTAGARADAAEQNSLTSLGDSLGDVLIRSEGGRIFLSEGAGETELRLGQTPERARLLRLLEAHGPGGLKLDRDPRLIMSGGGGSGFGFWEPRKSASDKPAPATQDPPKASAPPTPGRDTEGSRGSRPAEPDPAAGKNG